MRKLIFASAVLFSFATLLLFADVGGIRVLQDGTSLGQVNTGLVSFDCTGNIHCSKSESTFSVGGGGSGTVTSFSSGNLSPLFTASVATATTTPALSYTLSAQNPNYFLAGPLSGPTAAPTFRLFNQLDLPNSANADGYDDPSIFHIVDDGLAFHYVTTYHRSDLDPFQVANLYIGANGGYYLGATDELGGSGGGLGLSKDNSYMTSLGYLLQLDPPTKLLRTPRIAFNGGNAVAGSGNFALGAGWGDTVAIADLAGGDSSFKFKITAGGSGIAANPTIVYTFADGGWGGNYPTASCIQTGGTGIQADVLLSNGIATNTTLPMIWAATPTAAATYIIECHAFGRNN